MNKTTRICLWSGPRNISTTLMYSFIQRKDSTAFDEPLYAHYLANSNADEYHPGAKDVLLSQENNGQKVIQEMLSKTDSPVLFFKNMAHHLVGLEPPLSDECYHILLTRNPIDMLPSFHKVIPNPSLKDVGYLAHLQLLDKLEKAKQKVCVIESEKILKYPEKALKALCEFCEIPFDQGMLSWASGPKAEDGVWAKYWYANVHSSTGFLPFIAKNEVFPNELSSLLEECQPYFQRLKACSIV
jgi:hypothetical protein